MGFLLLNLDCQVWQMWFVMGLILNFLLLIWKDIILKQVSDLYLLLICEVSDCGSEKGKFSLNKLSFEIKKYI